MPNQCSIFSKKNYLKLTTPWFLHRAHLGVRWYLSDAARKKKAGGIPSSGLPCWDIKFVISTLFDKFIFFSFIYEFLKLIFRARKNFFLLYNFCKNKIKYFLSLIATILFTVIKKLLLHRRQADWEIKSKTSFQSNRHRRVPEINWI